MDARAQLKKIALHCTMVMGNGGYLTKAEIDEWNRLREMLGVDWDATNRCWIPYGAARAQRAA